MENNGPGKAFGALLSRRVQCPPTHPPTHPSPSPIPIPIPKPNPTNHHHSDLLKGIKEGEEGSGEKSQKQTGKAILAGWYTVD